jgi:hypothetical protein
MSIRRIAIVTLIWAAALAAPAQAQDSAEMQGPRAVMIRRQIEERFAQRVKEELGLTDEQTTKLRQVARSWFDRRRAIEADERALREALASQLRPGVAANSDSVTRLTQRLLDLKVTYAESYREENKELGFLTPVQRAQYYSLRERLLQMLKEAQQNRLQRRGLN